MNANIDKEEAEYYAEQARKEAYYDMPYYDHVLWSKARKLKIVYYEQSTKKRETSLTNTCNICKKPVPKRRRFCDSCKKKQSRKKKVKKRVKRGSIQL